MGFYHERLVGSILEFIMSRGMMMKQRPKVLAPVAGHVLEIGFGTGLNLPLYPKHVEKLTLLDATQLVPETVEARLAGLPFPVERVFQSAERLPLPDASQDFVVSTWTMCSIPDLPGALNEMRRVLKPGGELVFVEHGRSSDPGVAQWQDRLDPLWSRIALGCHLNRPMDVLLRAAGFELHSLERFRLPKSPALFAETYLGRAR